MSGRGRVSIKREQEEENSGSASKRAKREDSNGDVPTRLNDDSTESNIVLSIDLSSLVCPITNAVLEEPMLAEDGRTYSKDAILAWFKSCSERQLPITSPCTRKPISERIVPNADIAKSIEEYRKRRQGERSASGKAAPAVDATLAPKSLADLGAMFSLLDGLRQLLAETLDGWQPPQIVVVGQESSGKSSVLERLMMTPLLPRDENICTRLPIHVRLRRSDKAMPPRLEVYNTLTKATEKGPYVISAQYGDVDVSEEMRRILTEEQGSLRGVSSSRIIILHVTNPDVPFLDLVDMPGIVTVPSGNEPSDMATQTSALVKNHIQSEHGANSLYLAVVKASIAPNVSVALQILHEANLYEKTFGVFTFSDDLGRKHARKLEQWVRNPSDGQGAVELAPWGWVATTNAPPEDEHGKAVVYDNNYARLRAQAAAEVSTFRDMQLGQLVDDNLASHDALVSRLNRMFLDYLKNTWAPKTLRMLSCEQSKLAYDNALLGMPPAHEQDTPRHVKEAIAQEVERVLESGAATLMQQYATSLLTTLLPRQIKDVVQRAILDAFPVTWLECTPSVTISSQRTPSVVLSDQQDLQIREWLADMASYPDTITDQEAQSYLNRYTDLQRAFGATNIAAAKTHWVQYGKNEKRDWRYPGKATLKLELLYRASRDGWRATDFHLKCDNQGATVTVIKSSGGYVFGGYADLPWASSGQYLPSSNAFLFALKYPSGVAPVKMPLPQTHVQFAIYDHSSNGPTFGGGHDIHVSGNDNSNTTSYTNILSYELPAGQNAQTFLTGASKFQAAEIEVFRVVSDASQSELDILRLVVPLGSFYQIFEQPGHQEVKQGQHSREVQKEAAATTIGAPFELDKVIPEEWRKGVHYQVQDSDRFEVDDICVIKGSDGTWRFGKILKLVRSAEYEVNVGSLTKAGIPGDSIGKIILHSSREDCQRPSEATVSCVPLGSKVASSVCSTENLRIIGSIVSGCSGRRKEEDYGHVPQTYGPIVDLCKHALLYQGKTEEKICGRLCRTLDAEEEEQDDVPSDTSFWVEGVRAMFPADLQERPPWPSSVAQQLVDKPPCLLAKRFPGLIGRLIEEIKGDLKTKTDSLILDAVSRRVRLFSDEIVSVEGWRKKFTPNAVEISVMDAGRVLELTNDIVLIFLRYKGCMLQELQSSVGDHLVGRVSLRETCAEQRLEIISKEEALHRAKEGIFELLGLTTPGERQQWQEEQKELDERSKMTQSVILSSLQVHTILGWLGKQTKLELLYRASRDGWRAPFVSHFSYDRQSPSDFHRKCDRNGATVTVIKSTGGYVFGGYADLPWASSGQYLSSLNAFLFALQYPSGVAPVKMPVLQPQHAIFDFCSHGPIFGNYNICVSDNANSNTTSYTNITSYQLPAGQNAQTFFTGAHKFQAEEIEVFRVTS